MADQNKLVLTLYNKPAQILGKIPKRYRGSLISALISKSLDDGSFFEELSKFLTIEEINDLKENYKEKGIISSRNILSLKQKVVENTNNIPGQIIKKAVKKSLEEEKASFQEKSVDLFIGFDD